MDNRPELSLNIPDSGKPRVVVIGGGFGGVNAVKALKNKGFQIVLFDKHNYHTFQPLLYQVATAGLQPDSIAGPLRNIFRKNKDFYFRLFSVSGVDPEQQTVSTPAGNLRYDYLIIGGGMRPNFFGNKQIEENALPMKSIPDALNLRSKFMQALEQADMTVDAAERKKLLNIVLVGGGPTGVELSGALSELRKHVLKKDYPNLDLAEMSIHLVEGVSRLLPTLSEKAGARAKRDLEKMGVEVRLNAMVDSYDGKKLHFKNQDPIETYTVVWTAGVTSASFPGLKPEWLEKGRILVNEFCQLPQARNIYAIGDIALMKTEKYPKGHPGVAQVAIQMGTYLGKNLLSIHQGQQIKPFSYFNKGDLATIGRGKAVLDLPGKIFIGGRIAWYIWLFVHINYLVSFRNKLLVFASWVWNYFMYDKGNRLIIRPYMRKKTPAAPEEPDPAYISKTGEVAAVH
jgi:NADH dehydrogenase